MHKVSLDEVSQLGAHNPISSKYVPDYKIKVDNLGKVGRENFTVVIYVI